MRNLFDQYHQPENRLTHALMSALAEDPALMRAFVNWISGRRVPKGQRVQVTEQGLPGDSISLLEEEARGLPDGCIYLGDQWTLLVESKVAAGLKTDQLRRHLRTASRRGFAQSELLVIDTERPRATGLGGVTYRQWSDIYAWLLRQSQKSVWARRVADYFVVAENRFVAEGYLTEGTLTTFAGIPFGNGEPYTYPEAKRVLKLAIDQLRGRRELVRSLGMNPGGIGRGAITGKDGVSVWDYLPLKGLKQGEQFTRQPHLTLYINAQRIGAIVTVPNGVRSGMRRNLVDLGPDGFRDLMELVNSRLSRALRGAKGAAPWVEIVQRRYPSQRAEPIYDARVDFDLRTAFGGDGKGAKVRKQSEWLGATYDSLSRKRSNLQVAVGAVFPYRTCPATRDPRILDFVVQSWVACAPFVEAMRREKA